MFTHVVVTGFQPLRYNFDLQRYNFDLQLCVIKFYQLIKFDLI